MRRRILCAALAVVAIGFATAPVKAQPPATPRTALALKTPDGRDLGIKRRLVSKPGAKVINAPGSNDTKDSPKPFSTHYIFDVRTVDGKVYFEVGPPGRQPTGWIAASDAIEWPNNVTLAFNAPIQRLPVAFFRSQAAARLASESAGEASIAAVSARSARGVRNISDGVLAIEGAHADWRKGFYLMPVLQFAPIVSEASPAETRSMMVKTAGVPLAPPEQAARCGEKPSIGVVFVIDSTKSMGPYITRTAEAVQTMAQKIRSSNMGDRVSFGLVAFRGEKGAGGDVGYLTKVFQQLDARSGASDFASVVSQVEAATSSTRTFSEDALAGVLEAQGMDWSRFQARWIVVITDASPQEATVDADGVRVDIPGVASSLWDKDKIGLMALHLQTPEAKRAGDIAKATERLRKLATADNAGVAYYPVDGGDVGEFGRQIDIATKGMLEDIDISLGQLQAKTGQGDALRDIGYAQRVVWLGRCEDASPPAVEGWILDRAVFPEGATSEAERVAFVPRILLTRLQLDQLVQSLSAVLDASTASPEAGADIFFEGIASRLALAATDPGQLPGGASGVQENAGKEGSLGDMLPAYLSVIPYKPDFLTLTRREWDALSPQRKDQFRQSLRFRVDNLKAIYNDPDVWFSLHDQSDRLEQVTPVLLRLFP